MKAYVCKRIGPPEVLEFMEVAMPKPKRGELLIKVRASTVNAADCNIRGRTYIPEGLGLLSRLMLGFHKPRIAIQGSVLAGEVVEIGDQVQHFKVGDKVFGTGPTLGAYGEYACRPEAGAISIIPSNISYEEAATIPYGGLTALYFLKEIAHIREGQKILVKGASGGVGAYAVQLARYYGAEVTGVCSTKNVEFVTSLGANHVVDYTREDFTQKQEKWDFIFDVVVGKTSFKKNRDSLSKNGMYLAVAGGLNDMLQMVGTSLTGGQKVKFGGGTACEIKSNLDMLAKLVEENKIRPVLDRTFDFMSLHEAHRFVESGQKQGNIAITYSS